MLLQATAKARRELLPGVQTLTLRQRSVLLLAERRPARDLACLFNGTGEQIVRDLVARGYLAARPLAPPRAAEPPEEGRELEPVHDDP